MKAVLYGAGHIGRGFIGRLLSKAGYEAVFVDIDETLVGRLNRAGGYSVHIVGFGAREEGVSGIRAIDAREEERVIGEIAGCDIMATSLGARGLEKAAPLMARGLSARWRHSRRPLDILLCENLKDAAARMRAWLTPCLPSDEVGAILARTGLVEAAIGCTVPERRDVSNPLDLYAEDCADLPVDAGAFVAALPALPGLIPYEPFAFYEERKLYLHNMGHAVCAYLGCYAGHAFLWEAIADPRIRIIVHGAMIDSAAALARRHGVSFADLADHADDLILRFGNKALGDTCERVGRDPLRKLAPEDRLIGAARVCLDQGVFPAPLCAGIAAAVLELTRGEEADPILAGVCGLADGAVHDTALAFCDMLYARAPLDRIIAAVGRIKKNARGGPRPS